MRWNHDASLFFGFGLFGVMLAVFNTRSFMVVRSGLLVVVRAGVDEARSIRKPEGVSGLRTRARRFQNG